MVDPNQVIRYVEKNTDLADAVRLTSESAVSGRTTTFKGTRSKADGSTQEVTIEVLDTGARGGSIRYAVSVYPDDGVGRLVRIDTDQDLRFHGPPSEPPSSYYSAWRAYRL
jgi:hypothetical protein